MTYRCVKKWCGRCYGNFKWFVQSYPPLVLFTLSISLFAVLLTGLAIYVSKNTALNKVDVSQDWNLFFESFTGLEFCVIQDNSSLFIPTTINRKTMGSSGVRTLSVLMSLLIHPTRDFVSVPHSVMHLSASMNGKYIGLKGNDGKHRLNVTTIVPYHFNVSSCSSIPLQGCEAVELSACVELTGPQDIFPTSNRKPKSCPMASLSGVDYWAKMNWQMIDLDSVYYCRSRTMIEMRHEYDASLFQPLKKPHRSVIERHLLHMSFFLYSYVAVVLIYSLTFNHAKQRFLQPENPIYDF